MTRSLAALVMAATVALTPNARSAEADAEEVDRLRGRVDAHEESIEAFRRALQRTEGEVVRLGRELDALRQSVSRQPDSVSQSQLKALADQLQELEQRRVRDNKEILAALDRISRASATPPPPRTATPEKPSVADPGPDLPAEYHEHVIESGQTLSAVITEYNKALGYKVTLAHVLKANPEIKDPRRIRVGQTVRIPMVK